MRARFFTLVFVLGIHALLIAQTPPAPINPFDELAKPAAPSVEPPPAAPSLPPELASVVEKFQQAAKDFESKKKEIATTALGRYSSAAQSELSAAQFFLTCQQMVQARLPDLDGVTKKDEKEKQERVKQMADRIEEVPGRAAVFQLQLQYLVFTMEAAQMKDHGAMVSRLKDFASKGVSLIATYAGVPTDETKEKERTNSNNRSRREAEKIQDQRELERARRDLVQQAKTGVMGSVFAQAFNLQNYFEPLENWPDSPLNLEQIFKSFVFPYRQQNKPELLASDWDEYIAHLTHLERCSQDERGYSKWLVGTYKSLLWSKWRDLMKHGVNRAMAADELVKLIKENPTNEAVSGWVEDLSSLTEELMNPPAAPPAELKPN
jgi:hypothetical protein